MGEFGEGHDAAQVKDSAVSRVTPEMVLSQHWQAIIHSVSFMTHWFYMVYIHKIYPTKLEYIKLWKHELYRILLYFISL